MRAAADDPAREWVRLEVVRYGGRATVSTLVVRCLWSSVLRGRPVDLILVREPGATSGYDHKAQVTASARLPDRKSNRVKLRAEFSTMTADLLGLRD